MSLAELTDVPQTADVYPSRLLLSSLSSLTDLLTLSAVASWLADCYSSVSLGLAQATAREGYKESSPAG